MKIVVHDYAGHPFQVALSRSLADRGHTVTHVYFADNPGPKGWFEQSDTNLLTFVGLTLGIPDQTSLLARRFNDLRYGKKAAALIADTRPDVVISGNTPTEAQARLIQACKAARTRFIYWVQDIYSVAVGQLLTRQLGPIGRAVGCYYQWLDRRHYRESDGIVVIADDFAPLAASWSGDPAKVSVIQNWATIDEIPLVPKQNAWAREHGIDDMFAFMYAGTLGRKHKPELLSALARTLGDEAFVCVVGQGTGFAQLDRDARSGLRLFPVQPATALPAVLGSADVLVATIEPDAGTFAVPSKVLSYLCAGRPILLSSPETNLAARIVRQADAGIIVDPGEPEAFLEAAHMLRANPEMRCRLGENGRAYAERTFDVGRITDCFERVLTG
jgi:glycosyltransferase involved in cell wall biosynthesis